MKVLFISQQLKDNGEVLSGGDVCSKSLYKSFCLSVGEENVKLISIPEEKKVYKRYVNYLFLRNMYTKRKENQLLREINESTYDFIVLDGSWFGKLLNKVSDKRKVILFLHNIEIDYSWQRFKKNIFTVFKLVSIFFNERAALYHSTYIFVLNKRDKDLLWKYYGRKADLMLPIVIEDRYTESNRSLLEESEYEGSLLFVGSYFSPNVEGIEWFAKNVMPKVNRKLFIAGKNMEHVKFLETSNVKVLGTVDDLEELYIRAEAVVIPIFSGGGMKVKTAEAMMYGKKIYGTKEALIGYDVQNVSHIIECNTKEQFIDNINTSQETAYFYPEVRQRFLEKYEQTSRDLSVKQFLQNNL